ncbi:MAG: response regulator [Thermodesulfovibrionales bacterium]|nr:response regulator [Thermodesulfovibrionales bacterium]
MAKKVLIVDDEKDINGLIAYNLKKEGFATDSAPDGETALAKIKKSNYDLVILDLMLPVLQGIELCRIIRNDAQTASIPVIMLTAKGEEVDKVLGLEMGADDYITKPFSPRELVARINAVLRRAKERPASGRIIKEGDLDIDKDAYAVTRKGIPLKLSATEFRLLLYLVEKKGRVFNREQLLNAIWSDEAFVEPRTVDVHIRRLRAQIEEYPSSPRYIKTMRGAGYFFDGKK